jgi:hypothetical protein
MKKTLRLCVLLPAGQCQYVSMYVVLQDVPLDESEGAFAYMGGHIGRLYTTM